MTLLEVVKEYYNIFHCCPEFLRSLSQDRTEPSVFDSVIMRYLDGVLVMQYQFWIPDGYDGFVRQ